MADPDPGITDETGAALAVADGDAPGGAVVQSCADAKCGPCEGGETCCICVDVDQADPLKPCWPPYGVPRDRWCNGAKKCCCGTRVRATWSRRGRYFRRTDTPGVGFKQFDGTWEETAVFEIAVKRDADGKCVGFEYTYLKYDWKKYQHTLTEDKENETLEESHDPASIKNFLLGKMGNPQVLCRPEPVELAVALLGGGFSEFSPNGGGSWSDLFLADGCNGERKEEDNTPPATRLLITRWASAASCRTLEITAVVDNEFADQFSSGTRDMTQTVSMTLEVLEDECCPPPDGPGGPHGNPYNPAPDLVPVEPGDPENPGAFLGSGGNPCLRCGEAMRGEKCLWCGWCVSCGG